MTVSNLPPDWFAAEQIPILTAYCRHVCRSDQIELALAGLDPLQDLEEFDKLTELAADASLTMCRCPAKWPDQACEVLTVPATFTVLI